MSQVTITASNVAEYHGTGTPAFARLYANEQFITSESKVVAQGDPRHNPDFYQDFTCSMVGDEIQIATGPAYTTTDSNVPSATYTLCIYDSDENLLLTPFSDLRIPETNDPTSWDQLVEFSAARVQRDAPTHLDSASLLRILQGYVSTAIRSAKNVLGVMALSVDPDDPDLPLAVGSNDPRVIIKNAGLYTTLDDAVASFGGGIPGTARVLDITTQVFLLGSPLTIPEDFILRFSGEGSIHLGGTAFTVLGEIQASATQIFQGWEFGAPDISAAKFKECHFEWYGIISGANNSAAMQALIDARAGTQFGGDGTIIKVMPGVIYSHATPLNWNSKYNISVIGGNVGQWDDTYKIKYTGSGASSANTCKSAQGLSFKGVCFSYSSLTFSGYLWEAGHAAPTNSDTNKCVWDGGQFKGEGAAVGAKAMVSLTHAINCLVTKCEFRGARKGVLGRDVAIGYAVRNSITFNQFNDIGIAGYDLGQACTFSFNSVEKVDHDIVADGIKSGETRMIGATDTVFAPTIIGNWAGDNTATNQSYFCADLAYCIGGVFMGNDLEINSNAGSGGVTTCLGINACQDMAIIGNTFGAADRALAYHGAGSTGIQLAPNKFGCINNISNYDGGITGTGETRIGTTVATQFGSFETFGALIGGAPINAGTHASIQFGVVSGTLDTGTGSGVRVVNNISGRSDGALIIQPRTNANVPVVIVTYNGSAAIDALSVNGSAATFTVPVVVPVNAYGSGWNGSPKAASEDAVYDQMELKAPLVSPSFTTPALGAATATSLAIGGGTAITKVLKGTVTIDPASVAANTVADQTFTLTGAAMGDVVELNVPTAGLTAGLLVINAWISATNTLKVRFQNSTGAPIDAGSATWYYKLTR